MKLLIERRETFCASHRLYNPDLSESENIELYKKCATIHGHNYILIVSISGDVDPKTGMIIPFEEMKHCISNVVNYFDHTCLNDFEFFKTKQTTVENFSFLIWDMLEKEFKDRVILEKLVLYETEKNSVTLLR